MKPRLRAEGEGQTEAPLLRVSAGLWILFNCGLRPSNRNSVLALLKQRRFEVIQSAMALRAVCKQEIFSLNLVRWKDRNIWVSSAYKWWLSENKEIRELRGVVYSEKSRGQIIWTVECLLAVSLLQLLQLSVIAGNRWPMAALCAVLALAHVK